MQRGNLYTCKVYLKPLKSGKRIRERGPEFELCELSSTEGFSGLYSGHDDGVYCIEVCRGLSKFLMLVCMYWSNGTHCWRAVQYFARVLRVFRIT
jgi:hypothetical protein